MKNENNLAISDEELSSINNAVKTRYGIDFSQYEPVSLKRRIVRIIHKFDIDGVYGLWQKLLYTPDFIHTFRDEIAVGMTEMFRNPDLWIFLKSQLLKHSPEDLSIWHAGISSGEEVYSMAIMLHEQERLKTSSILATDLSSTFVKKANAGVFETTQFERYTKNYQEFNPKGDFRTYFNSTDSEFEFKKNFKSNIQFEQHNVMAEGPSSRFDWILCRNVMIYFNESQKQKTLKKFSSLLKPGGYLIIGYFDAMPDNYNEYFRYFDHGYKVFQKH